jgi:hypothetical protein
MLSHLLMLSRSRRRKEQGSELELHGTLSPDLISNIRQFGYTPSLRQLHSISQHLDLTIGGAFKLFGYNLERMRHLDFLLNGARTRLIDTYPFYRDRPVDVPEILGNAGAFRQNSFLSDLVRSWRHGIPARLIRGPNWRRQRLIYAQIGTNDGMASLTIPRGSVVAIGEITDGERQRPDPNRFYFLQHRSGYSCCRCLVEKHRLLLIAGGERIRIPQDFVYPGEVRIVGRVTSFAVRLPIPKPEPIIAHAGRSDTPLVLPWEHRSFASLLSDERQRFGITEAHLTNLRPALAEQLGVALSSRTLRRHEHDGEGLPRTGVLLAMTAVLSLRVSDVLRLLLPRSSEQQRFSLTTLMGIKVADELPRTLDPPSAPEPAAQWKELLDEWREWPSLISMTLPDLAAQRENFLRLHQSGRFRGLSPLLQSGSVVVVDDRDVSPPRNGAVEQDGWNRPIYVLRHQGEALCGYLESTETHFALQPHPLAGVPRLLLPRIRAQIIGRVIAVASPFYD